MRGLKNIEAGTSGSEPWHWEAIELYKEAKEMREIKAVSHGRSVGYVTGASAESVLADDINKVLCELQLSEYVDGYFDVVKMARALTKMGYAKTPIDPRTLAWMTEEGLTPEDFR